jgi:N-methylhydantoinase B
MSEQNPEMKQLDPVTLATTWHFLQRVCREMRETAERTATNVLVVTLHDMAYGIFDADARPIAIPEGFPNRLISCAFTIKRLKEKFTGHMHPGDVFLSNHPLDGASHLPDWVFCRPVFYKGELVFFTCLGTHVVDTGGAQAGSHFLAFDYIAEGLNIPLIKVVEKGELREDVLELILANNRLPDVMRIEIASLMGSIALGERRLLELLDKYDKETVLACIEEMLNRTEKAVRAKITRWPEGTWYAEATTDDDGATMGVPVTVRCRLTIKNGELALDFSDTDAQVKGMINSYYPTTLSVSVCTTFLFLGTELAAYHNAGSLRPLHVITKKGTIVDCNPGALIAGSPAITGNLVMETVLSVLSQALPNDAIAPYSRLITPIIFGYDPRANGLYVYLSFSSAAGAGAVTGYDGYQCACAGGTLGVVGKSDAEDEMVRFPWDTLRYEFQTDLHGAGRWRGAPGIIWEVVNEAGKSISNGGSWDGFCTQAPGQQGGEPTPLNKAYILRGDKEIPITTPHIDVEVEPGDHLVTIAGGGAGVGHPEERNPEAVRKDVRNELVSIKFARDVYKVVIDPNTLEINHESTKALRLSKNGDAKPPV